MLIAVDAATGDVLWSYRIDDPPYWNASSPIVADGRLYYVGSQVFAFQLAPRTSTPPLPFASVNVHDLIHEPPRRSGTSTSRVARSSATRSMSSAGKA